MAPRQHGAPRVGAFPIEPFARQELHRRRRSVELQLILLGTVGTAARHAFNRSSSFIKVQEAEDLD